MIERVHEGVPPEPFLDLYALTYGSGMSRDVFDWKYIEHPHGRPVVWTVGEADHGPWIGAMVLQPRRYRHGSRQLLAGQLVDLMVDPAHRRRGIFSAILRRILDEHRDYGFDLIFTVPATTGMSVSGFQRVPHLVEVGAFRSYRRHWRFPDHLATRLRLTWAASVIDPLVGVWGRARDRLRAAPLAIGPIGEIGFGGDGLVTDGDWVRWRLRSPGRGMRAVAWVGGGALLRQDGSSVTIYSLHLGQEPEAALRALLLHLERSGAGSARLEANMPREMETLLSRAAFLKSPGPPPLTCFAYSADERLDLRGHPELMPVFRGDLDLP
jgi:GNAT superfamily N-acetyltransferase